MYINVAILALLVFGYSLIAKRFESSIISGPIIFVSAGLLLGPLLLGWLESDITRSGLRVIADLTLAMVVVCTVFVSLILHGLSAHPMSKWISKKDGTG